MFQTPIVLIIFNRPDTTRRVFESIRRVRPRLLLVIGDGARESVEGEEEKVKQTREIIDSVDWPCEVLTNFALDNLGCKQRVACGLDWAFSHCESLIVLEDDCLPDPSFFPYCEELLQRYQDDERVMMISGDNFQPPGEQKNEGHPSYYFSRWSHIWGWASWRRAWEHFDVSMKSWPQLRQAKTLRTWFDSDQEYEHWEATLDRQYDGQIDTWDFPWQYACWKQQGVTILPAVNLVSNIGFRADATHTVDPASRLANLPVKSIETLVHPTSVQLNRDADRFTWETIFKPQPSAETPQPKHWLRRIFSSSR